MRSLFVTLVAAVACATGVVASPSSHYSPHADSLVPRGAVFDPRCECYATPLPVVIDDCTTKISPLVDQLKSLSAADCTADKIKPIAEEIKVVISGGIEQLSIFAKGHADVNLILSTGNGSLSVVDTANLLAQLVNLVFGTMAALLKLVALGQGYAVIAIFADLSVTFAEFVNLSCSLVTIDSGLAAALIPSIKASLGVVITLGITSHFEFLSVDFLQLASELGVAAGLGIGSEVAVDISVSLISIVTSANVTIAPLVEQLKNLSASDCTSGNVLTIVLQIKAILIATIAHIRLLAGQSIEVVLASDSGAVISVAESANIIGALINLVFDGLCEVIKTVPTSEAKVVISILVDLGLVVAEFIKVCISVVTFEGGLLGALIPVIGHSVGVYITLGITNVVDFLGIDWTHLGVTVGVTIGGGAGAGGAAATLSTVATGGAILTSVINSGAGPTAVPLAPVQTSSAILSSVIGGGSPTGSAPVTLPTSSDNHENYGEGDEDEYDEDCDDEEATTPGNGNGNGHGNGSGNGSSGNQSGNGSSGNGSGGDDEEDCEDDITSAPIDGPSSVPTSAGVPSSATNGVPSSAPTPPPVGAPSSAPNDAPSSAPSSVPNNAPSSAPSSYSVPATGVSSVVSSPSSAPASSSVIPTTAASSLPSSATPSSAAPSGPQCSALPDSGVVSVVTIVSEINVKITPLVETLKSLSASDCNTDKLGPIVTEIKAIFVAAMAQVKILVGAKVETVLASGCGQVISVSEFSVLFGALINLIFGAISIVIKTAGAAQASVVISIFVELGVCIGEFIQVVCSAVTFEGGLIVILLPIIKVSLGVCITLGITASFEFLQCDFTQIGIDLGISVGAAVSLVTVIQNCTTIITPLIENLKGLSASDCTADNIRPIAIEIKGALTVAIEQIKVLIGVSVEVVLASGSGAVISVDECAKLVGGLINLVLEGCGAVLKIVLSVNASAVISIFAELGICISELIKVCVAVVTFDGGLSVILIPIIKTSLGLCVTLGITSSFDFLGIDFTQIGIGATVSIVTIVQNCTEHVTPLIEKLKGLSAEECTAEVITPLVIELKAILTLAVQQISVLIGVSIEVALATGSGAVISVEECGKLIGGLVTLILDACAAVLKIVLSVNATVVIGIFAELGVCVGELVKVSCNVVTFNGGLVGILVPIIKTSLGVCITLGVTASFDILGIDFTQLGLDLGIAVGGAAVVSLPAIIADVTGKITPLIDQLKGLKASECSADKVGALIAEIKVIIVAATAQVKALAGVAINVALAGSDGAVLEISAVANLIAQLINLVFSCLEVVLSVVGVAQAKAVFGLCAELGVSLSVFIQACCSVIVGLQTALIPLITTSLGVCIQLAITTSFDFLGVDFNGLSAQLGLDLGGILNGLLSGGFKLITRAF